MISVVAEKLRAWLQQVAPGAAPKMEVVSQSAADPDGGTSSHHELQLDLARPSERGHLVIRFQCAVHGPTGECEAWQADIRGALPEERDALWEVFHPRVKSCRGWSNSVEPKFVFNGQRATYPLA